MTPDDTPGDAGRWPTTWAPYMTWAKHHAKAPLDLTGRRSRSATAWAQTAS
jgi:hypothetical protein